VPEHWHGRDEAHKSKTGGFKMKKLGVLIALLMGLKGMAGAFDSPKNPDRYVSMGLDVSAANQPQAFPGYSAISTDGTNSLRQINSELNSRTVTLDLRMPMTNWLTLDAHGGNWRQEVGAAHTVGYTFGGGFRVYFAGLDD
jgi:hypothetical protein